MTVQELISELSFCASEAEVVFPNGRNWKVLGSIDFDGVCVYLDEDGSPFPSPKDLALKS